MQWPIAIVLAAGKGKRMNSLHLPKVLVPLAGKPLLGHVLDTLLHIKLERIIVVVGHLREAVSAYLDKHYMQSHGTVEVVVQEEQRGTADAVRQAESLLQDWAGNILIVNGDVPLLRSSTLERFLDFHHHSRAAMTVMTADVPDPRGYGRIIRTAEGTLDAIIEEADLPEHLRSVTEVNAGIYAAHAEALFHVLKQINTANAQQEYYLTDAVALLRSRGLPVSAWRCPDWRECLGVNTPAELQNLELLLYKEMLLDQT